MPRVAITGASGLIGAELKKFLLRRGDPVLSLVRRPPQDNAGEIRWDPDQGYIDELALDGVEAVVHLAGENIAAGRWNSARKQRLESSRVGSTQLLSQTLARLKARPRVLICASAIGFYGDRGPEILDESAAPGEGFLPDLCRRWEAAAAPAVDAGIRVVHLRIGLVLSAHGGALKKMLTPFRLGLGGVIGSGRQYMSWIALDDLIRAIALAISDEQLSGPLNGVSPGAVTNSEFVKTLAKVLRRPCLIPLPSAAVKILFGEMGKSLLLDGARVTPGKLMRAGFQFKHPGLEEALRFELGYRAE